jgi:cytochrome c peroxidase
LTNDHGLGSITRRITHGTRFRKKTPGDIVPLRGRFRTPSVRDPDRRPYPTFGKTFRHNGVFRSLPGVVPFDNKRNLGVEPNGNEVAFNLRSGPPTGSTPLLPPPEVLDNVPNVAGRSPETNEG